jgi:hypothetical protein
MLKLRPNTLREIESILDDSYFTKDSFFIVNDPLRNSFIRIEFTPCNELYLNVKMRKDEYITNEVPGIYLESEEEFQREDFSFVFHAIYSWVARIKEDLDSTRYSESNIDFLIKEIKQYFLKYEKQNEYFKSLEKLEIIEKLSKLESSIISNKNKLHIPDKNIISFKETVENIKQDLNIYQKNIWCSISGNKISKEINNMIDCSPFPNEKDAHHNFLDILS